MKLYGIYFSPTGGTKKVLDILMADWDLEKELIDLSTANFRKKYQMSREDICIIAVPSFGGRVPEIVVKRLEKFTGDYTRTILTVVYGNRDYDDTLLELKNVMVERSFYPIAAISAIAKHSIMNQFASDRPNQMDQLELSIFSKEIINLVSTREEYSDLTVPGNYPYRQYKGVMFKPKGNRKCSGCGLCAKSCPVSAIPFERLKSVERKKCISCMRCVTICPNHARNINRIMLKIASKKMEKVCSTRKENQLFFETE